MKVKIFVFCFLKKILAIIVNQEFELKRYLVGGLPNKYNPYLRGLFINFIRANRS